MLIIILHSTGDGLVQVEPRGLGLGHAQLLPQGLCHIIRHQGVLGLDTREGVGHGGG